jgi:GNAT superfamily N-acetyltransferase
MTYTILPATPQHLPYLPSIEDAAGELFPIEDLPEPLRSISLLPEDFENALNKNLLWVVVDESNLPIAFLLARVIDGCIHIAEFDVHPAHGRRGVGSQLLNYVLAVAKQRAFQAVTLTTFEHLPWNAPYYSKHGFEVIEADKVGDELAQIIKKEKALGMRRRVAMKMKL